MTIEEHARHTKELLGISAEDIHSWIDGLFDNDGFSHYLRTGRKDLYNPYNHRTFRHCREALEEAYREFEGKYTKEQIRSVFETHIKDDYSGYIPCKEDFSNGTFQTKYHEQTKGNEQEQILSKAELAEYFHGSPPRQSRGFRLRIVFPTLAAIVLFITSVFIIILPYFRSNLLEGKKEMIHELTNEAASVIHYFIDQEKTGSLSPEEARAQAIAEIEQVRYGETGKEYFWITDMYPRMIMHPFRPELIGSDLTDYRDKEDKSGKNLFVEFVKLVEENNEGYLQYLWQWKDDPTRTALKLSYVKGIPEWGWIIGTGIYIHDIDEETRALSRNLIIIFSVISCALIILLLYIVLQSRRIEEKRRRAEEGMQEAKDRYRALVEASKEGYILEVGGEIVYSNHVLQRMLDYREDEIAGMEVWGLLDDGSPVNSFGFEHLQALIKEEADSAEFEAQVRTKQGRILDVIITTSRIFFSEKNGHVISFRQITREGGQGEFDCREMPLLREEIESSSTLGHVIQTLKRLPSILDTLLRQGVKSDILRNLIGGAYDAAVTRCMELSIRELGAPPVPFAFLSLGSNARHEMTIFSDQDNAIVFNAAPGPDTEIFRRYFLNLAEAVCSKLNQAGFRYCPGGIMASNPKWCLSYDEWLSQFSRWITRPDSESLIGMNVFFDFRCAFGEESLAGQLQEKILEMISRNPPFFIHFVQDALSYKTPRDIFGRIKGEKLDGEKSINIKTLLKPLEIAARVHAVHNRITAPGTVERLKQVHGLGKMPEKTMKEMIFCFDSLWNLRFQNQVKAHSELRRINDMLVLENLTELEQQNLKNILSAITSFQSSLGFSFLGNALQ